MNLRFSVLLIIVKTEPSDVEEGKSRRPPKLELGAKAKARWLA